MMLNKREGDILLFLGTFGPSPTKPIIDKFFGADLADVTIRRDLRSLVESGFLERHGAGRSTSYQITTKGRVFMPLDAKEYFKAPPDARIKPTKYDFNFFSQLGFPIFTPNELNILNASTDDYLRKQQHGSSIASKKELQRFVIELAWKSSSIEGNTYDLLATERLLVNGIKAPGHSTEEATMILNHKLAFDHIFTDRDQFKTLRSTNIEDVHELLVQGLGVHRGVRKTLVGITGTAYRPLDNAFQIQEALADLCQCVNRVSNPFDKALVALSGLAYLQAFEDGNKRTSRLIANAVLLASNLAPLSYRSVVDSDYRDAILVFYELRSLEPLKRIFIEQYQFSAEHYSI